LPSTVVELADANVAVTHIGALLSVVREALVLKGIDLLVDDESSGARAWPRRSWLVLGSLARREPLPSSDLDTALVWEDAPDDAATARALRGAADRLLDGMERCGLKRCPDGANASNPLFSRSQAHWVAAVTTWIREPNRERALLLAAMMADSRPISDLPLGRTVIDAMLAAARPETFLPLLLNFTLAAHPPTGFFRDFVVEHSGEHRGRLDLKGGGLLPVAALGRWVAMVTGDDRGTTPDRLRRGAGAGVLTDDEAEVLVGAFELFYGLLLDSEVESIRAGRLASTYLAPGDLDSLTRRYLKEAFREVARVQRRVEGEWVSRLT
jgi:CBS domain-containing protein